MPFPLIVIGAGIIGFIGGPLAPKLFATGGGHGAGDKELRRCADRRRTRRHPSMRCSRGNASLPVLVIGLLLWGVAMAVLVSIYGWQGTLTQMGWFFTKAALLTFGGAYAVLPYVYQGAVEHYEWFSAAQMIDGLALGETTPGPLIMVVAFVGFVGGWITQLLGPDSLFVAGRRRRQWSPTSHSCPSFIFILLGGPLVETTHGDLKFTAPLTGITAAVVGVILNLAVFFAYHVLWPAGLQGRFDWPSAVIGIAAVSRAVALENRRDAGDRCLRGDRAGGDFGFPAALKEPRWTHASKRCRSTLPRCTGCRRG